MELESEGLHSPKKSLSPGRSGARFRPEHKSSTAPEPKYHLIVREDDRFLEPTAIPEKERRNVTAVAFEKMLKHKPITEMGLHPNEKRFDVIDKAPKALSSHKHVGVINFKRTRARKDADFLDSKAPLMDYFPNKDFILEKRDKGILPF